MDYVEGNGSVPRTAKLRRQAMSGEVADDLRRRILSGELPEGRQLKQEQLASEFGISKVPVREALAQLEAEGFVTQNFHRGAVVAGLSPNQAMEMFELRSQIEVWLLGLAMQAATAEDVAEVARIAAETEQATDPALYPDLNWRFHEALYRPAQREYALDLVRRMHSQLERFVRLQFTLAIRKEEVVREHAALLALYAAKKPKALETLRRHIMTSAERLASCLDRKDGSPGPA